MFNAKRNFSGNTPTGFTLIEPMIVAASGRSLPAGRRGTRKPRSSLDEPPKALSHKAREPAVKVETRKPETVKHVRFRLSISPNIQHILLNRDLDYVTR